MLELDVGKRHVPDHGVDAALGEQRVAKVLDADVVGGVKRAGNSPGEGIEFDADKCMPCGARAMKFPVPHPGSRTMASRGTPRRPRALCMARMTVGDV